MVNPSRGAMTAAPPRFDDSDLEERLNNRLCSEDRKRRIGKEKIIYKKRVAKGNENQSIGNRTAPTRFGLTSPDAAAANGRTHRNIFGCNECERWIHYPNNPSFRWMGYICDLCPDARFCQSCVEKQSQEDKKDGMSAVPSHVTQDHISTITEECKHFPYENWVALYAEFQNKCPRGSQNREYLEGHVRESPAHILKAIFDEVFRGFMGRIEFKDVQIPWRPSPLHRCIVLLYTEEGEFCRPLARYLGQKKKNAKIEVSLKVWEVLISDDLPTLKKVESLANPKISSQNQRSTFFRYPVPPPPKSLPTYARSPPRVSGYSHGGVHQNEDASSR
eukprot:jgi/Bigna1/88557/estExt_fgenesh1_pg.C_330167